MKRKDFVLIILLCFAVLFLAAVFRLKKPEKEPELLITVDGKEFGRYSLERDQRIEICDTNICEIKDGRVSMYYADCPDRLCMHQKSIGSEGGTIICLPNRVFLEITDAKKVADKPDSTVF